jgi:hypothetical protein
MRHRISKARILLNQLGIFNIVNEGSSLFSVNDSANRSITGVTAMPLSSTDSSHHGGSSCPYSPKQRSNLHSSVFVNGHCGGSNSYYFNPHGEAAMLRPTPTPIALWEADHFSLTHYHFD